MRVKPDSVEAFVSVVLLGLLASMALAEDNKIGGTYLAVVKGSDWVWRYPTR